MAKMYPSKLPRSDISYAERTLFEALQKQLNNKYSVFHSFHWTEATNTPREIDFIVFHPEKGFVVLEVKGGKITIDNGEWFTENKYGSFHIDDPFRQVQNNMYFLLNFYKQRTKQSFPGLANYGVCFPDTKHIPAHAHPEMTRTNILFNHHLDDIAVWIEDLFNNPFYGYKSNSMNKKAVLDFNNIIKPSLQIPLSIRSALRQQQKELIQINFFQDYLLDIFDDKNRVAFQGAAGTGKTWIALKKAQRLISQGKNCLFLCYNSMLKKRLEELSKSLSEQEEEQGTLDIYTFHAFSNHIIASYLESLINTNNQQKELFFNLANEVYTEGDVKSVKGFIGLLSNPYREKEDKSLIEKYRGNGLDERILTLLETLLEENDEGYFNFNVPMGLLTLLEDNSYMTDKYDAIIIDEGHDFEKTWCDCLAYFLESKRKRIIYICYDDNQNIFMKKKQLPIIDLISK